MDTLSGVEHNDGASDSREYPVTVISFTVISFHCLVNFFSIDYFSDVSFEFSDLFWIESFRNNRYSQTVIMSKNQTAINCPSKDGIISTSQLSSKCSLISDPEYKTQKNGQQQDLVDDEPLQIDLAIAEASQELTDPALIESVKVKSNQKAQSNADQEDQARIELTQNKDKSEDPIQEEPMPEEPIHEGPNLEPEAPVGFLANLDARLLHILPRRELWLVIIVQAVYFLGMAIRHPENDYWSLPVKVSSTSLASHS